MPDTLGEAVLAWYKVLVDQLKKYDVYQDKGWRPSGGAAIMLQYRGKSDNYRRLELEHAIRRDDWPKLLDLCPVLPINPIKACAMPRDQAVPWILPLMFLHEHCYAELYHTEYSIAY